MGNQQWTIQRNWKHRVQKTKTNKTKTQHNICWAPLYICKQTHKIWALIQATGGKDEQNIIFMWKSKWTSQHGTQNVKTHIRTRQKTKNM